MANKIKIDGNEYVIDDLSDVAKKMLQHVRMADAKLEQLKQEGAMIKLARDVYAKTLHENLPRQDKAAKAAPKKA